MFSFRNSEPNADVPGPGFSKKGLGADEYDEKMYLTVSPLKIQPLLAVAQFNNWKDISMLKLRAPRTQQTRPSSGSEKLTKQRTGETWITQESSQYLTQNCMLPCWKS